MPRLSCLPLLLLTFWHSSFALPVAAPDTSHPYLTKFIQKFNAKNQDLTIVLFDGSISTDMGYATKRADSSYRPPCTTEYNIPSFIEEIWRWPGQQFRRYDAKLEQGSKTAVFTELGNAVTRQYDSAWDWQNKPPVSNGYNGLTRILSGPNASVSFLFPTTARRTDFIYRTDYLSSAAITVSVAGRKNEVQVFDEFAGNWKEADGFVFSAREPDQLIPGSFYPGQPYGASSLRKTIYQKRLKMRCSVKHTNLRVTLTNSNGARLCYWGIAYSPIDYMVQFINSSRGGHNIEYLTYFEPWSVDYWKPDLVLFSCNTINEGADASAANTTNSPIDFATRFKNYTIKFLNKPYKPEFLAYVLFTAKAHNLIVEQGNIGKTYIPGYGEATVFNFMDTLAQRMKTLPIEFSSAFYYYWDTGNKNAQLSHQSLSYELFGNFGGAKGPGFTGDNTHLNDNGARVGWKYLQPFFDISGATPALINAQKIYDEVYVSYSLDNPRSTETVEPRMAAAYEERNFGQVVDLAKGKAITPREQLLLGIAYLETDEMNAAINILSGLRQQSMLALHFDADFYLGLAYLKNKDYANTITAFSRIASNAVHPYHSQITEKIIEEIRQLMCVVCSQEKMQFANGNFCDTLRA